MRNHKRGHWTGPETKFVYIITPVEIYTVILANNDNDYNENKLKCVFLPHPHVGIVIENLLNLPGSVLYWVMAVCRGTISIPRPSLIQGEVKLAAKYNGEVGAMTLYKD